MTVLYITGFEFGLATFVTNGGGLGGAALGTIGCDSSVKRTGSYSCKAASTGSTAYFGKQLNTSPTTLVGSVYFRTDALPSTQSAFFRITTAYETYLFEIRSTGKCRITGSVTGNGTDSNTTISANTWYLLDFQYSSDGGDILWKINGTDEPTFSFSGTGAANYFYYYITGITNETRAHYLDDLILTDAGADYPIGAHEVIGIRPTDDTANSVYGTNTMEDVSGTDLTGSYKGYQFLDDSPWVSTTGSDLVRQGTVNTGALVECALTDVSISTTIMGVFGMLQYHASGTQANQGACFARSNATDTTIWGSATTRADYSESSQFYKSVLISPDGGSWSDAKVDALVVRIGYSNDITPYPYWCAIIFEVAYKTPNNYQQSVSGALSNSQLTGGLIKQTARSITGAILSNITQRGILNKETQRKLSGIFTGLGNHDFEGALTYIKLITRTLTAALSTEGKVIKEIRRTILGTLTSVGENEEKSIRRTLTAALSTAGVINYAKLILRSLAGTLSTGGTLIKQANRTLTGTLTAAGTLIKQTARNLAGAISPSATLTNVKVYLRTLTADLSTSGTLQRVGAFARTLTAALTTAGTKTEQIARRLTGSLTTSGGLIKLTMKYYQSTLTASGLIIRRAGKYLSGALGSAGGLIKWVSRTITGVLSPLATLIGDWIDGSSAVGTKILRLARRDINLTLDSTRAYSLRLTKLFTRKTNLRLGIRSVIIRLNRLRSKDD